MIHLNAKSVTYKVPSWGSNANADGTPPAMCMCLCMCMCMFCMYVKQVCVCMYECGRVQGRFESMCMSRSIPNMYATMPQTQVLYGPHDHVCFRKRIDCVSMYAFVYVQAPQSRHTEME